MSAWDHPWRLGLRVELKIAARAEIVFLPHRTSTTLFVALGFFIRVDLLYHHRFLRRNELAVNRLRDVEIHGLGSLKRLAGSRDTPQHLWTRARLVAIIRRQVLRLLLLRLRFIPAIALVLRRLHHNHVLLRPLVLHVFEGARATFDGVARVKLCGVAHGGAPRPRLLLPPALLRHIAVVRVDAYFIFR
jgi:hypothetical protein